MTDKKSEKVTRRPRKSDVELIVGNLDKIAFHLENVVKLKIEEARKAGRSLDDVLKTATDAEIHLNQFRAWVLEMPTQEPHHD